jgi:hypothetical protein
MMEPDFVYPPEPVINATQAEIEMWENCLDKQLEREFTMAANLQNAYSLIHGQCSNALCIHLQLRGNHAATEDTSDAVGLLKSIWQVLFGELEAPIYGGQKHEHADAVRKMLDMIAPGANKAGAHDVRRHAKVELATFEAAAPADVNNGHKAKGGEVLGEMAPGATECEGGEVLGEQAPRATDHKGGAVLGQQAPQATAHNWNVMPSASANESNDDDLLAAGVADGTNDESVDNRSGN